MRKQIGLRITRIVLWLAIIILSARGMISIFTSPTEAAVKNSITDASTTLNTSVQQEVDMRNFAERFSTEYLTYEERDETYAKRLLVYGYKTSDTATQFKGTSHVQNAKALKIHWVSDTQVNVDVVLKVVYADTSTDNIGLRVPLTLGEAGLATEGSPLFIDVKPSDAIQLATYEGTPLEDVELLNKVSDTTKNFIKNYYEGSQAELSVYLENPDSSEIQALGGKLKVDAPKTSVSIYSETKGNYVALVSVTVMDANGTLITQNLHLTMHESAGRILVVSCEPRIQNIQVIQ